MGMSPEQLPSWSFFSLEIPAFAQFLRKKVAQSYLSAGSCRRAELTRQVEYADHPIEQSLAVTLRTS